MSPSTDHGASEAPRRILIADDDGVGRRLLERLFTSRGYEVVVAADGSEAWQIMEHDDAPGLAVLDWSMPGLDGVDVCRRLRSRTDRPYAYVLLLTARSDTSDLVEALDAGADDYLSKPFRPDELVARVRAGERVLDVQSALLDAQERLRMQATFDALTGVRNREAILGALSLELERARNDGTSVAVLMIDIDRFKDVNDTHGHDVGDAVIRDTVARIKGSLRANDSIGRYGGEEILVVLPGCLLGDLRAIAERARLAVADALVTNGGRAVSVTISLGAAASGQRSDISAAALVTEADRALYRAKNGGRNRAEYGDDATQPQVSEP